MLNLISNYIVILHTNKTRRPTQQWVRKMDFVGVLDTFVTVRFILYTVFTDHNWVTATGRCCCLKLLTGFDAEGNFPASSGLEKHPKVLFKFNAAGSHCFKKGSLARTLICFAVSTTWSADRQVVCQRGYWNAFIHFPEPFVQLTATNLPSFSRAPCALNITGNDECEVVI